MKITDYTCDICGTQKKKTNHWWILARGSNSLKILPFRNGNTKLEPQRLLYFLCGEFCLFKKMSLSLMEIDIAKTTDGWEKQIVQKY